MGYNTLEALPVLASIDRNNKLKLFDEDFTRLIPKQIDLEPNDARCAEIANEMREFYFNGKSLRPDVYAEFLDLLSDYHFTISEHLTAELHTAYQRQ